MGCYPSRFSAVTPMLVYESTSWAPCLSITPALKPSQLESIQLLPSPFLDVDYQVLPEKNYKTKPTDDTQIHGLLS